jgi:endoribonuclease Nob1
VRPTAYVLDTSLLLGGKDPPRDAAWMTTREATDEIKPGGRDARRLERWLDVGLQVRGADRASQEAVTEAAAKAGNLARLSPADLSLLALALAERAVLVTDDHTMLDVALRLGVATQTVNSDGIAGTLDFRPRCSGCGRWFEQPQKGDVCPVCGSPVKPRPVRGKA